jgi:lysophospholipase L1-like esterase
VAALTRAALVLATLAALSGCSGFAPVTSAEPPASDGPTSAAPTTPAPSATTPPPPPAPPATLRVVGLGDSVMAGTRCGCRGLVEEYAAALGRRTGRPVHVTNLGTDGAVTTDVVQDLSGDRRTRTAAAAADVLVVTVGANDLLPQRAAWQTSGCNAPCYQSAAQAVGRRLGRLLRQLAADRGGRTDHVLVTDYWNVFRDGQVALDADGAQERAWSVRVTAAANREICTAARAQGAACVDLVTPFKGRGDRDPTPLLADDGDHPNAAGERAIVRALVAATPTDL